MKDLIIGMASGYTDEQLKPFVNSLKRTGYDGDLVLIRQNPYNLHPIVSRFKIISDYLKNAHYEFVITCDTSDIVFQSNPLVWVHQHLDPAWNLYQNTCVVSEQTTFAQSEGNKKNILEAFGQEAYEQMKDEEVCNAGVIAGTCENIRNICSDIYELCLRDRRPQVPPLTKLTWDIMMPDQSALNLLISKYRPIIAHAEDNFVHNYSHPGKGENAAILHQYLYDRENEIREKYKD